MPAAGPTPPVTIQSTYWIGALCGSTTTTSSDGAAAMAGLLCSSAINAGTSRGKRLAWSVVVPRPNAFAQTASAIGPAAASGARWPGILRRRQSGCAALRSKTKRSSAHDVSTPIDGGLGLIRLALGWPDDRSSEGTGAGAQ